VFHNIRKNFLNGKHTDPFIVLLASARPALSLAIIRLDAEKYQCLISSGFSHNHGVNVTIAFPPILLGDFANQCYL
jgi:hypothetical protein